MNKMKKYFIASSHLRLNDNIHYKSKNQGTSMLVDHVSTYSLYTHKDMN